MNPNHEDKAPFIEPDHNAFARGCFYGVLMAVPFWMFVFLWLSKLIKH